MEIDENLEIIKLGVENKITVDDIVWPKLRTLKEEYKLQIEKLEFKIKEKNEILKHKIRHKTDKKILLKLMVQRKNIEKKRDHIFELELKCESILGESYENIFAFFKIILNNIMYRTMTMSSKCKSLSIFIGKSCLNIYFLIYIEFYQKKGLHCC